MKRLFFYLRIYRKLIANYLKDRMSFRVDFFMGIVGWLCVTFTGVATLVMLFRTIPSLADWNYWEMLFLYGFYGLASMPLILLFDKLWWLSGDLVRGDFILCYFKPLNMMFYYMSDTINTKTFGSFAVFGFIFVYAAAHLSVHMTALKVLCFILMFLGAAFTFMGIRIIVSSTAFWIGHNVTIMNFTMKLETFSHYPLTIFSRPIQIVFLCVLPYAFVAYVPVNELLHSPAVSLSWFLTPLVGAVVFALGCLVWTLGVRHWSGTGT